MKSNIKRKMFAVLFCILAFLCVIPAASAESGSTIVYITNSGTKYHKLGCQFLSKSCIECTLEAAVASGYEPCKKCKPPILSSFEIIDSSEPVQTAEPAPSFVGIIDSSEPVQTLEPDSSISEPVQKIETVSDSSGTFEKAETVSRSSPSFTSEPDPVSPSVDQRLSSAPFEKTSSFSEDRSGSKSSEASESESSGAGAGIFLLAVIGFIVYRKNHKK